MSILHFMNCTLIRFASYQNTAMMMVLLLWFTLDSNSHDMPSLLDNETELKRGIVFGRSYVNNTLIDNVIQKAMKQLFPGLIVHIVVPLEDLEIMSSSVFEESFTKWHIILTKPNTKPTTVILSATPDVFIVFINSSHISRQFQELISDLNLTELRNQQAKYLLVATTNLFQSKAHRYYQVIATFNFMWKRNAFRIALIVSENNGEVLTMFSSSPFSQMHNTCNKITNPAQLQEINLKTVDFAGVSISGYKFRVPKTFLGCLMTAYTFPFPPYSIADNNKTATTDFNISYNLGIEMELVTLFAKLYNCSVQINTPDYIQITNWFQVLPNGTTVGMLQDILTYKIDLAFAGAIASPINTSILDQVFTLEFNSMSWYVPDAERLSRWRLITTAFSNLVWLLLISAFAGFSSLFHLMTISSNWRPKEPVFLTMCSSSLSLPTVFRSKTPHLRIMLITWVLFSLPLTTVYNTRLFSVLTNRPVVQGIQTIEELNKSGLKTYMKRAYHDFYIERTEFTTRDLLENGVTFNNVEDVIEDFIRNRHFSIMDKDDHMSFLIDKEREKMHTLNQKFMTYPVAMYVTKGSVLLYPFNRLIEKTTSSGLNLKWLSDVRRNTKIQFSSDISTDQDHEDFALNVEDFIWLFVLLLSGHLIAFVVFILELCYNKYDKLR